MVFSITLILAGTSSAAVLWYRVSQKIPELVAIPDEVIIDRLHEDSAQIRVFLLNIRRHWRERAHQQIFLRYAEKTLFRGHILMLRMDNSMVAALKKVRALLGETNGANTITVTPAESPPAPSPEAPGAAAQAKHSRIQEVRRRRMPRHDTAIQQKLPE